MTSSWPWPHFTAKELACKCICREVTMDETFMAKLETIRVQLQAPMVITSGYRCPAHNASVSSTGNHGPHTTGHATDIRTFGTEATRLIEIALRIGMTGIGISQKGARGSRFIHLDDLPKKARQPRPWVWSY